MCAVSDAGNLAVLLAGLVQTLVTVDVDQGQLLHGRETQRDSVRGDANQAFDWLF